MKVGTLAPPYAPGRQTQTDDGEKSGRRGREGVRFLMIFIIRVIFTHLTIADRARRSTALPPANAKLLDPRNHLPPASRSNDKCGNNTLNYTSGALLKETRRPRPALIGERLRDKVSLCRRMWRQRRWQNEGRTSQIYEHTYVGKSNGS